MVCVWYLYGMYMWYLYEIHMWYLYEIHMWYLYEIYLWCLHRINMWCLDGMHFCMLGVSFILKYPYFCSINILVYVLCICTLIYTLMCMIVYTSVWDIFSHLVYGTRMLRIVYVMIYVLLMCTLRIKVCKCVNLCDSMLLCKCMYVNMCIQNTKCSRLLQVRIMSIDHLPRMDSMITGVETWMCT